MLEVLLLNNKLTHFVENSNVIWRLSNYINVAFFPSPETPQSYCPSPLIQAEEGRNVSLPCYVDPSVDLSAYTVDWKHTDLNDVVFSWRHGQENHGAQAASYRSRASIDSGDLSRGNLTLQIFSACLSDSGRYRCFVPKLKAFCIVHLNGKHSK